jgi:PadR family transcriptional regulator, regulatory protein PadR
MTLERIDLPQGTLDLLILRTLSLCRQHGWAISERVQQISGDVLRMQQGSLYPTLHRLESRGWIKAKWGGIGEQPASQILRVNQDRAKAARN